MGEIKVNEKDIVVPGEVIATGMDYLPSQNTYRLGDDIRAAGVGIVRIEGKVMKLTPLSGRYIPKNNDVIIAQVTDVLMSGWRLDTNSAYPAVLPLKDASSKYIEKGADLTKFFALGDYVMCKITNVTSQKLVDVTMKGPGLRKIEGGRVIEVNTNKVPRVIGKQGSMVTMIKDSTGCRIAVGQNGIIWVEGEPEKEIIAVSAIKKIEEEAHVTGLTDRIKDFLEKETGKKPSEARPAEEYKNE
ncbi:MAG: exosome complex RNA-binding protein Rrp4 [Candidatus Woesearchaeota archaeon]